MYKTLIQEHTPETKLCRKANCSTHKKSKPILSAGKFMSSIF